MKLKKNSFTARVYRWFYGYNNMPQTVCPYFWQLVIMWICIAPYTLLSLPTFLSKETDKGLWEKPVMGMIAYCMLFALGSIVFAIPSLFMDLPKDSFWDNYRIMGIMFWMIGIPILTYRGIASLYEMYRDRQREKRWEKLEEGDLAEKEQNILVEFIKATYHKYCPKIDWE